MAEGSSQRDRGTSLGRDDRIHGSLLIINELIMNSAWSDEVWVCMSREGEVYDMVRVVNPPSLRYVVVKGISTILFLALIYYVCAWDACLLEVWA
jgi:hypothetical protein